MLMRFMMPDGFSCPPPSSSLRLEGVEARLQETVEEFEQTRQLAKKTKSDFEKVKKQRCVDEVIVYFKCTSCITY